VRNLSLNGLHFTYVGQGSKVTTRDKKGRKKQLALANQEIVSKGFPENEWALGFGAFAFAFPVCGGIVLAGCPDMCIRKGDQTDGDHQAAEEQSYGQITVHVSFLL
jgi:hypothetical protein